MPVCLFVHIPPNTHVKISLNFLYMQTVATAQSYSNDNAINFVLAYFWMTSLLGVMWPAGQNHRQHCLVTFGRWRQQSAASLPPHQMTSLCFFWVCQMAASGGKVCCNITVLWINDYPLVSNMQTTKYSRYRIQSIYKQERSEDSRNKQWLSFVSLCKFPHTSLLLNCLLSRFRFEISRSNLALHYNTKGYCQTKL